MGILSGIKADIDIPMSFGEHADAILLQIDGIRYVIYNDPEDGWRSTGRLYQVDDSLNYIINEKYIKKLKTETLYPIPDEKVIVKYSDVTLNNHSGFSTEYYEFFNADTNQLILKIGTDDYDDWYPCCIFQYNPENLSCNMSGNVKYPSVTVQNDKQTTVCNDKPNQSIQNDKQAAAKNDKPNTDTQKEKANIAIQNDKQSEGPIIKPYANLKDFFADQKKFGPYIAVKDNLYCIPANVYYDNTGEMYVSFSNNDVSPLSFNELADKKWQNGNPCGKLIRW